MTRRLPKTRWLSLALLAALSALPAAVVSAQDAAPPVLEGDQCMTCHMRVKPLPKGFLAEDVHVKPGLSCAGCHGGDPTITDKDAAHAAGTGYIGVPSHGDIPALCGKCHSDINYMRAYQPRIATDQTEQYFTSVHGMRLKEGDQKVATCTSCHTSHGVLPASDSRSSVYPLNVPYTCKTCHSDPEYMSEYPINTRQFDDYARGVHGVALLERQDTGSPACNDCHGNHGAMPPGTASVSQVCGHCHVNNMTYFSTTVMAKAFEEEELHACEECHGNHYVPKTSDDMVGVSENSVCIDCHEEGDKGYQSAEAIHAELMKLVTAYDSTLVMQKRVHRIGMDDVEINFLMQEGHQSLIQARTLVHTFDPKKVGEKTDEGLAKVKEAAELARAQFTEHRVRRRGFGMATIFITVIVIALFLKLRDMERA